MQKCCSKCNETKPHEDFIKERNICKPCINKRNSDRRKARDRNDMTPKTCSICNEEKPTMDFIHNTTRCKVCNQVKRRDRYAEDESLREVIRERAREYKSKKTQIRQKAREDERLELESRIGEDNKICRHCNCVRPKSGFRWNRQKCTICERDNPIDKFKRNMRTRIWSALTAKTKHTIEYLGCSHPDYVEWLTYCVPEFKLEDHGKIWHIDHVIPVSHFDLDNESEQLIAFNWRNTVPLLARDNLAKNNALIYSQMQDHYTKLVNYHTLKQLELPEDFIQLFAKHLVAGSPLEPLPPLCDGNIAEELG